ncbi:hypothetical protein EJB05_14866, partial [Eragrostis curvula]
MGWHGTTHLTDGSCRPDDRWAVPRWARAGPSIWPCITWLQRVIVVPGPIADAYCLSDGRDNTRGTIPLHCRALVSLCHGSSSAAPRPPPPPSRRPLGPASVSIPTPPLSRCRRARFPSASLRPPPSPRPPLPKKRAAAAGLVEEDGAVVDEEAGAEDTGEEHEEYVASVGAGLPANLRTARAGQAGDPVFFLLTAVAVTTSVAFTAMVAVAIPTMLAMRRAANSFCMLADAALEELPSTMAAVRLSGLEISDLTLELSDLSHEIADGVNKSAKVAEAVEAGIGQMGDIARQQAMSMIKERANWRTIPTAGDS